MKMILTYFDTIFQDEFSKGYKIFVFFIRQKFLLHYLEGQFLIPLIPNTFFDAIEHCQFLFAERRIGLFRRILIFDGS